MSIAHFLYFLFNVENKSFYKMHILMSGLQHFQLYNE